MSDQGCNLVGQWQILVGHCPVTDCYLQPCQLGYKVVFGLVNFKKHETSG